MKRLRRKLFSFLGVSLLLFLLGYVALRKVTNLITETFKSKVVLVNEASPYQISYGELDISIIGRSFRLNDVLILPDTLSDDKGKLRPHLTAGTVSADNFEVFPLLFGRHLTIGEIYLEDIDLVYKTRKKGSLEVARQSSQKKKERAINTLNIEQITVKGYSIVRLSKDLKDTLTNIHGETLSVSKVTFEKIADSTKLSLNPSQLKLSGSNLSGSMNTKELKLFDFELDISTGFAQFKDLQIGNREFSKNKALHQKFNTPISTASIENMTCFGMQIDQLFRNKEFRADSLVIDQAKLHILKNLDKDWDKSRVVPLPQSSLKNLELPFWINEIRIKNSGLDYVEFSKSEEIVIPVRNLNIYISDLGTIRTKVKSDSIHSMKASLDATLFDDLDFKTEMEFKDPLSSTAFSFKGSTGPFRFESFNPIMVPTSNIKFESGHVSSIDFNGTGNAKKTSGEFVMKYDDLKTTVLKHKSQRANKTFSWLANTAVRKQNPKRGKLKVATMGYRRVPYKGFGNYIFKTIESGMINSVYPFGARKTQ